MCCIQWEQLLESFLIGGHDFEHCVKKLNVKIVPVKQIIRSKCQIFFDYFFNSEFSESMFQVFQLLRF